MALSCPVRLSGSPGCCGYVFAHRVLRVGCYGMMEFSAISNGLDTVSAYRDTPIKSVQTPRTCYLRYLVSGTCASTSMCQ